MSINIKPDEMKLHRSISSMFHLSDDGLSHYLLAFGVLELGTSPSARRPLGVTCNARARSLF